jgi:hypothetical protein
MCENLLSTNSDALFCGELWYAEGLSLSAQQICNPVRILQPATWTKLAVRSLQYARLKNPALAYMSQQNGPYLLQSAISITDDMIKFQYMFYTFLYYIYL